MKDEHKPKTVTICIKSIGENIHAGITNTYQYKVNISDISVEKYVHSLKHRIETVQRRDGMDDCVTISHSTGFSTIPAIIVKNSVFDIYYDHDESEDVTETSPEDDADYLTGIDIWECDLRNAKEKIDTLKANRVIPRYGTVSPEFLAIFERFNSQRWHACPNEELNKKLRESVLTKNDIIALSENGHLINGDIIDALGFTTLEDMVGVLNCSIK